VRRLAPGDPEVPVSCQALQGIAGRRFQPAEVARHRCRIGHAGADADLGAYIIEDGAAADPAPRRRQR
jgi:hypothetical protein